MPESYRCERNLELIGESILRQIRNGDVPFDAGGRIDFGRIQIDGDLNPCGKSKSIVGSYVSATNLCNGDFAEFREPKVVLADKPGNHILLTATGQIQRDYLGRVMEQSRILMSDGKVPVLGRHK